jgi:hypothetical protein
MPTSAAPSLPNTFPRNRLAVGDENEYETVAERIDEQPLGDH